MRWHPRRFVGGSGGTYSCSFFHSSVSPGRTFPRLREASSRVSDWMTLPLAMYWTVWKRTRAISISREGNRRLQTNLGERSLRGLERDLTLVVDYGGNPNGLSRDVAAPVKGDLAHDRASVAAHPQLVLDLATQGLLERIIFNEFKPPPWQWNVLTSI